MTDDLYYSSLPLSNLVLVKQELRQRLWSVYTGTKVNATTETKTQKFEKRKTQGLQDKTKSAKNLKILCV